MDGTLLNKKYRLEERVTALEEGGGGGGGLPDYSTDEQATGQKWIDGKNVYQKVIVLNTPTAIDSNTWFTIGEFVGNTVLEVGGINTDNNYFPFGAGINNGSLEVFNMRNAAMTMVLFIVKYTKNGATAKRSTRKKG